MNNPKFIIVVGASAGGMAALSEFVAQLKTGMGAAFFIVMHLSRTSISGFLMHRVQPITQLQCEIATEGALIQKRSYIYCFAQSSFTGKKRQHYSQARA